MGFAGINAYFADYFCVIQFRVIGVATGTLCNIHVNRNEVEGLVGVCSLHLDLPPTVYT